MSTNKSRRKFVLGLGAIAATGLIGTPSLVFGASRKVVIAGGGTAGATAARYLHMADPGIEVTLIEANKDYYTCYMSNEVLSGERKLDSLKQGYSGLKKEGIKVVHDFVTGIDTKARKVTTKGGNSFKYDRCIVAPGIDFKWDAIKGYDAATAEKIPHAWKAGPQTTLLRKQLLAMKDGGTVVIAAPPNPFRCPPGPYERAAQIAHYLKNHKPKSKVLVLDAKDKFSKMGLFKQGWERFYGDMIEWVSAADGGKITGLNLAKRTLYGELDEYQGDVLNIIPPQKAAPLAFKAGLTDASGWCPIDLGTFESTLHKNIHIIGDAGIARGMPKSAYAANSQAKVCAAAVADLLNGREPGIPSYVNTCYSIIAEDWGVSVAAVYRLAEDRSIITKVSGGLTPMDASIEHHRREVENAYSWLNNITVDAFGQG